MEEIKIKVVSKQLDGTDEKAEVTFENGNVSLDGEKEKFVIVADQVDSETSSAGQVLTSNGSGGASWETIPTEGLYKYIGTADVNTINALDTSTLETGDTYNVSDSGTITLGSIVVSAGDNIAWVGTEWDKLASTVDLTPYYDKSHSLIPNTTNAYDLGSSTYTFKDLYLGGSICLDGSATQYIKYGNTNYIGFSSGTIYVNKKLSTDNIEPQTNNASDLGSSSKKWKNLYLVGSIYGGTFNATFDEVYGAVFNFSTTSSNAILYWSKVTRKTLSADTTFTFETAKTDCLNEYKAIITNSGANTITLTFTGITNILCNDDNCVVTNGTNSTLTLPASTTIEINAVNNCLVAINFSAN